ncbi:hypothetical protein JD844_026514 [Phrynosoma platyrhinos]|uniref:Rho guanine nucleotide exchange factor 38 n=1 Tax=Phrynosoma platyrhinos TaxID=52577 RepID=A0ABQ7SEZ6_PHRPL|nr:hypothetical protein JD844_026514 [Phrynosoma platyrhinos]
METKEPPLGKESLGPKKKNLPFLRHRLYMLERRKTDTVVESNLPGDHNSSGTLRRSQSDRSEYSQKLQEKMAPQAGSLGPIGSPLENEEELNRQMMARRQKIIAEMVQTESDYLGDLELCIRIVVEPLRRKQITRFDVDGLFSNIESVHQISTKLLSLLEEATTGVEPAMQVIGQVFLQIKDPLEDAYKVYCYHHDDAHILLESYEKDEELKQHIRDCLQSLKKIYEERGKPNLLDMGSLMIKPIQRVMKYPLLLCELLNATPLSHPDHGALQDALVAVKAMNMNINELKRRKDIVLKYKKNDEDETLKEKFSRLNIHSISKKSKRVTGHLKILTGGELQDSTLLAEASVTELQNLLYERENEEIGSSETLINAENPNEGFLIQKRYDKLLDYNSCHPKVPGDERDLARREYEALNAQLVEELQIFNRAAKRIVTNCLCCLITLLRDRMSSSLQSFSNRESHVTLSSPSISEVHHQVLEEVHNLNFVKENNSITFIERKLSFEKKKCMPLQPEFPRQTESHRTVILSRYNSDLLYQAKRKCNATQELDIDLYEGEVVAVVEQKDPFGSTSRWLVDTGIHAFQARSQQELSLQEYQRVRILRFSDLSGNKEWWLAEAKGQKGYVPANYLGKMTYA